MTKAELNDARSFDDTQRKHNLEERYFNWMRKLVCDREHSDPFRYEKLFRHLNSTEFVYILAMDGNREADGIDLRYRFAYEKKYDDALVEQYLDSDLCSILEMMVALAVRCEEHVMCDPDIGDRTWMWFWEMIGSLGLTGMTDDQYQQEYVERVLRDFMLRRFSRNGHGGLFTIQSGDCDMRSTEIWYQLCHWLNEFIG